MKGVTPNNGNNGLRESNSPNNPRNLKNFPFAFDDEEWKAEKILKKKKGYSDLFFLFEGSSINSLLKLIKIFVFFFKDNSLFKCKK